MLLGHSNVVTHSGWLQAAAQACCSNYLPGPACRVSYLLRMSRTLPCPGAQHALYGSCHTFFLFYFRKMFIHLNMIKFVSATTLIFQPFYNWELICAVLLTAPNLYGCG